MSDEHVIRLGPDRLTARWLIAEGARTFRERFARVLAVGALVALAAVLLDEAFDLLLEANHDRPVTVVVIVFVGLAILTSGANSFGSVFLSGLLDKTVGEHQHGHPYVPLRALLVTLPFLTLITADLLVTTMRGLGALLLILPSIVVMTLTAVTGPVVIIERRGPVDAIRRSFELTGGAFWLTFRAVTVLLLAEVVLDEVLDTFAFSHVFAGHIVVSVVLEVPLAIFVSLVEVTLAYQLVGRDRLRKPPAPPP